VRWEERCDESMAGEHPARVAPFARDGCRYRRRRDAHPVLCAPSLSQPRGEEHNDVTKFAFGVVGFVFAFFIGFVVSAMWGQVNDADGRARIEGTAGVQLVKDAVVFDDADRYRTRTSLLEYEQAAVAEWTEVANGPTARPIKRCPASTLRITKSRRAPTPRRLV
jgi:hypothetical protein